MPDRPRDVPSLTDDPMTHLFDEVDRPPATVRDCYWTLFYADGALSVADLAAETGFEKRSVREAMRTLRTTPLVEQEANPEDPGTPVYRAPDP